MNNEATSLDAAYQSYQAAIDERRRADIEECVRDARRHLPMASQDEWSSLIEWLRDEKRKWFVAAVFAKAPVPKRLFEPFLTAAINEKKPSLNRQFVEPCIHAWGHRRVNEHLLAVVEAGDAPEIAGAVAALYWANMSITFSGEVPEYTLEHATPESRAAFLELKDVWERKRELYLTTFINKDNVEVRRQIIPSLKLDESVYCDELKPLVGQAIEIARNHEDDYIRHRVEVQLGNEKLLKPLPDRE